MAALILIIEDDEASRDLVKYLLETAGYGALAVADGGNGLRMALENDPDLVICDLQMPVMDGYEVVAGLRGSPTWRRVPVIAVTAFSMAGDRGKALAAGFNEHLTKPITPETFVGQIEAFLPASLLATQRVR
jgi:two-component system cell cycle response regulator DivK